MDRNRGFEFGVWIPCLFCFVLVLVPLFINGATNGAGLSPVLLCFLPMCFVFVGMQNLVLHRRLAAIEARQPAAVAPPSTDR